MNLSIYVLDIIDAILSGDGEVNSDTIHIAKTGYNLAKQYSLANIGDWEFVKIIAGAGDVVDGARLCDAPGYNWPALNDVAIDSLIGELSRLRNERRAKREKRP